MLATSQVNKEVRHTSSSRPQILSESSQFVLLAEPSPTEIPLRAGTATPLGAPSLSSHTICGQEGLLWTPETISGPGGQSGGP